MSNLREQARADLGPYSPYCAPSGGGHPAMLPIVWSYSLSGFEDEFRTCNGVPVSRVGRWLVWQTEQGFIHGTRYESADKASTVLEQCEDDEAIWGPV